MLTGLKGAEKTVTRADCKGVEDMHEHVSRLLTKEGALLHESFASVRSAKTYKLVRDANFVSASLDENQPGARRLLRGSCVYMCA